MTSINKEQEDFEKFSEDGYFPEENGQINYGIFQHIYNQYQCTFPNCTCQTCLAYYAGSYNLTPNMADIYMIHPEKVTSVSFPEAKIIENSQTSKESKIVTLKPEYDTSDMPPLVKRRNLNSKIRSLVPKNFNTNNNTNKNFCPIKNNIEEVLKNHKKILPKLAKNQDSQYMFRCNFCDLACGTKRQLASHIERCHTQKYFKCHFCGMKFEGRLKLCGHITECHFGGK